MKFKPVHGMSGTRIYLVWRAMLNRCNNPNVESYRTHGARGITVCKRWHQFTNFYADMGDPPPGHSIDRINNNGNYEPGNCRWATPREQNLNSRMVKPLTYQGKTQSRSDWGRQSAVSEANFRWRINNGWPMKLALTLPKGAKLKDYL